MHATMRKTPLESWIARKIGVRADSLNRELIAQYQLNRLRETLDRARHGSPFYRDLLKRLDRSPVTSLGDFTRIPFTTAEDIRKKSLQFLCVSQSEISRVKTLDSSGTTGQEKRMYFTPSDQELTVDFFHHGMSTLVGAGDRVLILLPGEREGSVGDLLGKALRRLGAEAVPHGVVRSLPETIGIMERNRVHSLVGIPVQVLALARYAETVPEKKLHVGSALLSTDYVPQAVVRELRRLWDCEVFEHYGMSEMGLGGGVECGAHAGYHLREADLYFEIIDPQTGAVLPEGKEGEIVVTTLTRRGMPLVRYRTGDISRFLSGPCPCGTMLRRMAPVAARQANRVELQSGETFTLGDLDEALFAVERVIDYTAAVDTRAGATMLALDIKALSPVDAALEGTLAEALHTVAAVSRAMSSDSLALSIAVGPLHDTAAPSPAKRTIMDMSEPYAAKDGVSRPARQNTAA